VQEYRQWLGGLSEEERKRWRLKYYKGLGTNSAAEGREYFADLAAHSLDLVWEDEQDDKALELVFGKRFADERKRWLQHAAAHPPEWIDHTVAQLTYKDFVHRELVQFSLARCAPRVNRAGRGVSRCA
jgi:DNA topoisomerase-2